MQNLLCQAPHAPAHTLSTSPVLLPGETLLWEKIPSVFLTCCDTEPSFSCPSAWLCPLAPHPPRGKPSSQIIVFMAFFLTLVLFGICESLLRLRLSSAKGLFLTFHRIAAENFSFIDLPAAFRTHAPSSYSSNMSPADIATFCILY